MPIKIEWSCMQQTIATASMESKFLSCLIVLGALNGVLSDHSEDVHVVSCPDQQESCICNSTAKVCDFTLRIEQRQTFVSYALSPTNKQLTYDGTGYFLDSTGYHPTANNSSSACAFYDVDLRTDQDFTSRNCSVPMTVDGVAYRSLIAINGRTPGPTLVVSYNQTLVIHVLNYLQRESISIHWHGLFQHNTPWMDGVGFITQPPIDPGATFDYIYNTQQNGSYWYHSHVGSQRTQGLYGGLVIRPMINPLDAQRLVPEETTAEIVDDPGKYTLTMIDWHRESAIDTFLQLNSSLSFYPDIPPLQVPTNQDNTSSGNGFGPIPFWSGLINGRGRFDGNTATPLSVFSVERNKHYRFRLIGTVGQFAYKFSIDNHTLRVVATDGWDVEHYDVEYVVVHAGERYDFLVNTNNDLDQPGFWMRAETLEPPDRLNGMEHSARAILTYGNENTLDWRNRYSNVPEQRHQCSSATPCRILNCPYINFGGSAFTCSSLLNLTAFTPMLVPRFPPTPGCSDCMHFLNFDFRGPNGDPSINGRGFQLPPNAYQTHCGQYQEDLDDNTTNTCNMCDIGANATEGCRCINVLPYASDAVFDPDASEWESIAMVFSSDFPHPIHMHGHSYHIVYIGYNRTEDIDCSKNERGENTSICTNPRWKNDMIPEAVLSRVNPDGRVTNTAIRKDTVIIPKGGYVVIAFQANNPGYWFLHCHIEHHQLQGMIVLLQEYPQGQHWAPPDGINQHGSFTWDLDSFQKNQAEALLCENVPNATTTNSIVTPTILPGSEALEAQEDDNITISRAGFGVTLTILLLLAVTCVILIIALVATCCKKNPGRVNVKSSSSATEGFDLSRTTET